MSKDRNKRTPDQQTKISNMLLQKKVRKSRDQARSKARDAKYYINEDTVETPRKYSDKDIGAIKTLQAIWRHARFQSCMVETKNLIAQYDIRGRHWWPGPPNIWASPGIFRCSKYSGGPQWECYHYQGDLVHHGLCRSAIVQEMVFSFLCALTYKPTITVWRKELNQCPGTDFSKLTRAYNKEKHNLARVNLAKSQCISRRRCAAIVIQRAFHEKRTRDHLRNMKRGDNFGIRLSLDNDTHFHSGKHFHVGKEWYQLPEGVSYTFWKKEDRYIFFKCTAPFDHYFYKGCEWKIHETLTHIIYPIVKMGAHGKPIRVTATLQRHEFHLFNSDENTFYQMHPIYLLDEPDYASILGRKTAAWNIQQWYRLTKKKRESLHKYALVIQKRWRLYQIKRMKPFYLVPLPTTDSHPYLIRPELNEPWKQKPSFRMIYSFINNEVIAMGSLYNGGPRPVAKMDWHTQNMSVIYWDLKPNSPVVALRRWKYGKDYSVRITKDVERFGYKRLPI